MFYAALIVFAIGATLGATVLAPRVLRGRFAPWPVSVIHALFGATGLVLLAMLVIEGFARQRTAGALVLFGMAACGGFFLASYHVRRKLPPGVIVVVHAGMAVLAFLTLLSIAFIP